MSQEPSKGEFQLALIQKKDRSMKKRSFVL